MSAIRRFLVAALIMLSCSSALAPLAAQQPGGGAPAGGDQASSIARVVRFLEQTNEAKKEMVTRTSGKVDALQRALGEVDAALGADAMTERDKMEHAARSMDGVLASIDALLEHETETRRMFGEQARKLTAEWRRVSAEGAVAGTEDAAGREARATRARTAAHYALDPDTPPEWRGLFELAFDLLDAGANTSAELSEQQQQIWVETVNLLDELRKEVYAAYATDLNSYHGLRAMRTSKQLQKELLVSGRDLESLREVSRGLRQASQVLVRPDDRGAAVTDKIRDLLGRARQADPANPGARTRTAQERRRAMEDALRAAPKAGN